MAGHAALISTERSTWFVFFGTIRSFRRLYLLVGETRSEDTKRLYKQILHIAFPVHCFTSPIVMPMGRWHQVKDGQVFVCSIGDTSFMYGGNWRRW